MAGWLERQRRKQDQKGFTLIELLVVIIILGILAAVVVFAVGGVGDKGKAAAEKIDVRTIRTAEEAHCAQFGRYATEAELVTAGLLSEQSKNNYVYVTSGGSCGDTSKVGSAYQVGLETPTETVNVAANADRWQVSDTGSGDGYDSSAFVYPLNSNLNDPLVIIASNYTLQPGLATSWDLIPTNVDRATFTSPNNPVALPVPPHRPYVGLTDRPYNAPTWRFHLRQGVKFHDGSDFDALDVIWTWRDRMGVNSSPLNTVSGSLGYTLRGAQDANAFATVPAPDQWDSVEMIDQFTVDFTPKTPNLRLPEQIGHPKGAIVAATGVSSFANDPALQLSTPRLVGKHLDGSEGDLPSPNNKLYNPSGPTITLPLVAKTLGAPIGTGPFEYVNYAPTVPQDGGTAEFKEFPGHWGAGAQVKTMKYSFLPDPTQRTSGLLSGQFDYAVDLDAVDVDQVEASGRRVVTASYGQNLLIYINKVVKDSPASFPAGTVEPLTPTNYRFNIGTDPAVRKALSLAIDRQAIVDTVFEGNAAVGRWMAPPDILGVHQSTVPALGFDAVGARTTLDAAGWTCGGGAAGANTACGGGETRVHTAGGTFGGKTLKLYLIGSPDTPLAAYELLEDQLEAVGIDLQFYRAPCNASPCGGGVSRGQMYNSVFWDLDMELPNQNDANPAFLPVLRMACKAASNFRFAPVDGANGIGPAVADTAANGNGTFPFGKTPCTTGAPNTTPPSPLVTPFDTQVTASDSATTTDGARIAAAEQMRILVAQNQSNVVVPVVGQFRIYGMGSGLNLSDPHPSQTSQRWQSLTKNAA